MRITASSDVRALQRRYQTAPARINTAVRVATTAVGVEIHRQLVGREGLTKYPRHPRGTMTPSPPGEPPAQVTTNLRKTVYRSPATRVGFAAYELKVAPTVVYARAQEKGRPEINLPARPYVQPTRDRVVSSGVALRLFQTAMARRLFP